MNFSLIVNNVKAGQSSIARESPRMLRLIAKIDEPEALKECRAQAAAIAAYLGNRKDGSVEEYNAAVMVRTRVEHRLGEVLSVIVNHSGGRPTRNGNTMLPLSNGTIPDGIDKMSSSRAQQLARIPWAEIEDVIKRRTQENQRAIQSRIVNDLIREMRREADVQTVANASSPAELKGVFSTIVIDPPWDYRDEGDGDGGPFGCGKPDFATLTIDQIMALPVDGNAAKDAHIYLWITNRSLPKGFMLLEAWGFRYITCLTWCKPSIGMGTYFRGSTEQVLFGVRGTLPLKLKNVGTWFTAPRGDRKHSSKPPEFFDLVESCSYGPYLEMFSRSNRKGWTHWGAQTGNGKPSGR